jgi:O-acetyl-ADP-ribose deacetylase (regulator of RNase III)
MENLHQRLEVQKGNITAVKVDAIVNAANTSLLGGGGVDGAIHRAGGSAILEECRAIVARQGGCKVGEAVVTTAGNLPAQYVIHTVGPIWRGGHHEEATLLSFCYTNSLKLALENVCKTIAFPAISTGVYGYPKDQAAQIAVQTIRAFLAHNSLPEKVLLVCFDEESFHLIRNAIVL